MLIPGFNLATADYRRSRRDLFRAAGIVAALTVLLAGQVAHWAAGRQERRAVGEHLERMEAEFRRQQGEARAIRTGIPSETMKQYEAKVAIYNQIIEASAFSWTGLLVELERSVPPSVYLTEIQPDLATGRVSLRGATRSFDDLSVFLHGLEERKTFRDVYLLHQTTRKATPGKPEELEFAVTLLYQGRGR